MQITVFTSCDLSVIVYITDFSMLLLKGANMLPFIETHSYSNILMTVHVLNLLFKKILPQLSKMVD